MSKTRYFHFLFENDVSEDKTWFLLLSITVQSGALCMDAILCQGASAAPPVKKFFFTFFNSFPNLQGKGKPFIKLIIYLSLNFYAFDMSQLVDSKISGTIEAYTSCFFHSLQSQGI